MDTTVRHYDEHAGAFLRDTLAAPMETLYAPFLAHIPARGRILDAGCGVGRDSRAFLDRGYDVVSFDASSAMVAFTTELTGRLALHLRFQELAFHAEFDGVWACASLVHVPRAEIEPVLRRLLDALKPGGVLYASFKHGNGERIAEGRLFNDYDEPSVRALAARFAAVECLSCWTTRDVRPARSQAVWTNLLLRLGT